MPDPFVLRFVVGVTPGKWSTAWRERMPRHPLELVPSPQAEALAALLDGTANIALVRGPVDKDVFHAIRLYSEVVTVVAPRDHALEAADEVTLTELEEFVFVPGAERADDGWADSIVLVAANVGIATMPKSVARMLARKDVVARPVVDAPETEVFLVWPRENDSAEIQTFIGIVRGRTVNSSR